MSESEKGKTTTVMANPTTLHTRRSALLVQKDYSGWPKLFRGGVTCMHQWKDETHDAMTLRGVADRLPSLD
jgi:hypothetical protein